MDRRRLLRQAPLAAALARLSIAAALAVVPLCARAAEADDFYNGKQIQIVVSTDAGTVYDSYARLLAEYLPAHVRGNPSVVVVNMPGGGGLKVANYIANIAPRDGTVIAGTHNAVLTMSRTTPDLAKFDERTFGWIGSVSRDPYLAVVWYTVPIRTIEDAKTTVVSMGGPSAGSLGVDMVVIANALIGTKFKLIAGYKDPGEIRLAMQRGEVDGTFSVSWSELKPTNLLQEGKVRVIAQHGFTPFPAFGDAPLLIDQAKNEADRQALIFMLGRQEAARPYFAPPGLPPARLATLRAAFAATVQDPAFLHDAATMNIAVDQPMEGARLADFVAELDGTSPEVIARINKILTDSR
jgi:tripartite-type tricarboxylate transporter receptor subunit TctC